MEQPELFLHMDNRWMWRWYNAGNRGQPLAMSKNSFFTREEAVRNIEAAQMAVIGL